MEIKTNNMVRISISEIQHCQEVLKEQDYHLFEKLKKSISLRGQIKNIVVYQDEDGNLICIEGNKILKALKELGYQVVFCVHLGKLSKHEADLIRLEISRDYFLTDYVAIGKILKRISNTSSLNDICSTIPFDKRQANNLIQMFEFDWEKFNQSKENENQFKLFSFDEQEENYQEEEDPNQLNLF